MSNGAWRRGVAVSALLIACLSTSTGCSGTSGPAGQAAASGPASSDAPADQSPPASRASEGAVSDSARPSVARHVPAAALRNLRAAVHRLTVPRSGSPTALRAKLVRYRIDSWDSADDFTLLVSLDLHFPTKDTLAWNEGSNERFIHFTRAPSAASYHLGWATGP
jgi:hypothetical protein